VYFITFYDKIYYEMVGKYNNKGGVKRTQLNSQ